MTGSACAAFRRWIRQVFFLVSCADAGFGYLHIERLLRTPPSLSWFWYTLIVSTSFCMRAVNAAAVVCVPVDPIDWGFLMEWHQGFSSQTGTRTWRTFTFTESFELMMLTWNRLECELAYWIGWRIAVGIQVQGSWIDLTFFFFLPVQEDIGKTCLAKSLISNVEKVSKRFIDIGCKREKPRYWETLRCSNLLDRQNKKLLNWSQTVR